MSVFTTPQYDATIWTPVKTVHATHTEAVSLLRGIVAGFTSIVGGKQDILNKKMDDITHSLLEKMRKQVGAGECIIGLNIELSEFGREGSSTTISGLAMGTLLRKSGKGGGARKTRRMRRRA